MGLRPHRRNLVIWAQSAQPDGKYGTPGFTRPARARQVRRWIRTGGLLTLLALMLPVRVTPPRWRLVLAGVALTAAGVMLRGNAGSLIYFPGILFLLSALLAPDSPKMTRTRRAGLAHELTACSTLAQRRDLGSTLDRYPDGVTYELRDILASVARDALGSGRFG